MRARKKSNRVCKICKEGFLVWFDEEDKEMREREREREKRSIVRGERRCDQI